MAVSHSFAGEHVEDGSGEEADADHDQYDIEHGYNPRVYHFLGRAPWRKPESGLAGAHQVHPEMLRIERHPSSAA